MVFLYGGKAVMEWLDRSLPICYSQTSAHTSIAVADRDDPSGLLALNIHRRGSGEARGFHVRVRVDWRNVGRGSGNTALASLSHGQDTLQSFGIEFVRSSLSETITKPWRIFFL
jgi:hypothetical protein